LPQSRIFTSDKHTSLFYTTEIALNYVLLDLVMVDLFSFSTCEQLFADFKINGHGRIEYLTNLSIIILHFEGGTMDLPNFTCYKRGLPIMLLMFIYVHGGSAWYKVQLNVLIVKGVYGCMSNLLMFDVYDTFHSRTSTRSGRNCVLTSSLQLRLSAIKQE
jgi:hypothetical protein